MSAALSPNDFLDSVLPTTGFRCVAAISKRGVIQTFHASNDDALKAIETQSAKGLQTYFGCATFLDGSSREAANVAAIKAFWADIDCGDGKPYPDQAAGAAGLKGALKAIGLPAPMVVNSGYGLHVYWVLTAPIGRDEWQSTARALKAALAAAGLRADPSRTADAASILRPPGTLNRKASQPVGVYVVRVGDPCEHVAFRKLLTDFLRARGQDVEACALTPSCPTKIACNADLRGGIGGAGGSWFDALVPEQKDKCLEEMLACPGVQAIANCERGEWLKIVMACAQSGAPSAESLCRKWSETSLRYNPAHYDRDWRNAIKSTKTITVGTLIHAAEACGWEPSAWRSPVVPVCPSPQPNTSSKSSPSSARAAAPLSAAKPVMTEAEALAFMNDRYAWCNRWGDTGTYIEADSAGDVRPIAERTLLSAVANLSVIAPSGKDGPKRVPIGPWWIKQRNRATFDRAIYDPEGSRRRAEEELLNLWRGFDVEPVSGSWRLMCRHIRDVWCDGDMKLFRYVIQWFAFAVQRPGTIPGTVLLAKSKAEGTGKTIVTKWLSKMFGRHCYQVNSADQVTGQFNAHLEKISLLIVNEPPFAGDHEKANKFKSMVTETEIMLERKHCTPYMAQNNLHIVMTTNEAWAVAAGADARRYVILEVSDRHKGNHAYFDALAAEAENGGIEAMFWFLSRLNISKFNPREIPVNDALRSQQMRSLPIEVQWALALTEDPAIAEMPGFRFGTSIRTAEIFAAMHKYSQVLGKRMIPHQALTAYLKRLDLKPDRIGKGRDRGWMFPDEDSFRDAVEREGGIRAVTL